MIASDPDGCKGVTINGPKGRSLEAALPKDPPLLRRLKYTKEVLFNLLNGNKVPEYGS